MATKLKNLDVTKVDFVDAGANQRADIKLTKRKEPEGAETPTEPAEGLFKRFLGWLKSCGTTAEEIEKAATSFNEQLVTVSMDQIRDEMWSVCYALQNSLNSILCDVELDGSAKAEAMKNSTEQFAVAMGGYIEKWSSGMTASIRKNLETPDDAQLQMLMKTHENIGAVIEKANSEKGELEEMIKIDKSKMTPEERAAYDDIIKKYAVETDEIIEKGAGGETDPENDPEGAEKGEKTCKSQTLVEEPTGDDIYKGLHPLVAAELKNLKKRAEESEERELFGIAKKYEIIGKKAEELVPTLKALKAAGGTAYDDMIGVLDGAVSAMEASGMFGEIGKSCSFDAMRGMGTTIAKSASESKIETIAKGYMEKDPSMSYTSAVAKAWENHPELIEEYEDEEGF